LLIDFSIASAKGWKRCVIQVAYVRSANSIEHT